MQEHVEKLDDGPGDHRKKKSQVRSVEDEPEDVLPNPPPEGPLFPTPWSEAFQNKAEEGDAYEPEVVLKI